MTSRKQHPAELRERAVAMVFELRAASGSSRGTLASVGHKLGVNPETLRNWVEKAEIDSGQRPLPLSFRGYVPLREIRLCDVDGVGDFFGVPGAAFGGGPAGCPLASGPVPGD